MVQVEADGVRSAAAPVGRLAHPARWSSSSCGLGAEHSTTTHLTALLRQCCYHPISQKEKLRPRKGQRLTPSTLPCLVPFNYT